MDIKRMLEEVRKKPNGITGYVFRLAETKNKVFIYRMENGEEVARYFFNGIEVLDYDFEEYRYAFPMTEEEFRGLETEWNKARSVIRKELRNGIRH